MQQQLKDPNVAAVVAALQQARQSGEQADACGLALADAQQAYAAQAQLAQALGWFAAAPQYWKSGGPNRQAPLTHAPLPPAGVWPSPAQLGQWPAHVLGIEAEIALRLGQDVSPEQAEQLDYEQALGLVDAMAVSIELVDFRWQQAATAPFELKLADSQSHGALVLGDWQAFAPRDWSQQRCQVQIGVQAWDVRGKHTLGDPAWLLPTWLRHACQYFGTVSAGTVVTTGSWIGMPYAQPGDLVRAVFEGIGEAQIQL